MKSRILLRAAALCAALLAIAGCGPGDDGAPPSKTVSVAYVPAGYYAPLVIAAAKGMFERRGYTFELKRFNDNSLMINTFINGQLDLTAQSSFTMFDIEAKRPGHFSFVYGQLANSYFFIAPSSGEINSIGDLKGKKIGTWQSPTAVAYVRLLTLRSGLSESDFEIVRFPVSDVAAALQNKLIDAAFTFDVQCEYLVQGGAYKYVERDAIRAFQNDRNVQFALFNGGGIVNRHLIEREPEKLQAIKDVMREAIAYIENDPVGARTLLAERLNVTLKDYSRIPLDDFQMPNESLRQSAADTAQLLVRSGVVSQAIDTRRLLP